MNSRIIVIVFAIVGQIQVEANGKPGSNLFHCSGMCLPMANLTTSTFIGQVLTMYIAFERA